MRQPKTVSQARAAERLGVSAQAVSQMIKEGALLPTGPDGALTLEDLAALEWSHKCRDLFHFKVDQLRPFVRLIQRDDREMLRRCVLVKRRIGGEPGNYIKRWTIEVFPHAMTGDDAEIRRKVADEEGSDIDTIEFACNLERFADDTFWREVREMESAAGKEARNLRAARERRKRGEQKKRQRKRSN